MKIQHKVIIKNNLCELDGTIKKYGTINDMYYEIIGSYPKFHKMDGLCKVGMLAAESLLHDMSPEDKENGAIILFNKSSSLITDRNYQKTISNLNNYFPSPGLFVYTLANIVTGEIAIRHKIKGETSFYLMEYPDWDNMESIIEDCLKYTTTPFVIGGWVEYYNESEFYADIRMYKLNQ